uniref:Uncharacterized protein n=1 Tax=Anguilla anguilla TaxID=7936 RepID=A0A0E9Q787_ANGAN
MQLSHSRPNVKYYFTLPDMDKFIHVLVPTLFLYYEMRHNNFVKILKKNINEKNNDKFPTRVIW